MEKDKPCLGCRQNPCNCYYEQCPDCLKFINHGNLADCCQCGGEEEEIPFGDDPGEDWPPVELWDDGE